MLEVRFVPTGGYCLDEAGAKDVLINLELYRASLQRCNSTIEQFNLAQ